MNLPSGSAHALAQEIEWIAAGKLDALARLNGGREAAFRRLVEHVALEVPAYGRLAWKGSALASLAALPPTRRDEVAATPDIFRSRGSDGGNLPFKSSGTTGPPTVVQYDAAAAYVLNSRIYQHVLEALPSLAGTAAPGALLIGQVTSKPSRELETVLLPTDPLFLWRRYPMDQEGALAWLGRDRPPIFYGKPMYLRELLDRMGPGAMELRPEAVLVSGERLYSDDRAALSDGFGAPVINAYVTAEAGPIAASQPDSQTLEVFGDLAIVEVWDGDSIASSGQGELLVTSSFNWRQPMLRYRTGDWASVELRPDGTQLLSGLRRMTEAEPFGSAEAQRGFEAAMFDLGIWDFELRLAGASANLAWAGPASRADLPQACEAALATLLDVAEVHVRRVDRVVPPGGKRLRYPAGSGSGLDARNPSGPP